MFPRLWNVLSRSIASASSSYDDVSSILVASIVFDAKNFRSFARQNREILSASKIRPRTFFLEHHYCQKLNRIDSWLFVHRAHL